MSRNWKECSREQKIWKTIRELHESFCDGLQVLMKIVIFHSIIHLDLSDSRWNMQCIQTGRHESLFISLLVRVPFIISFAFQVTCLRHCTLYTEHKSFQFLLIFCADNCIHAVNLWNLAFCIWKKRTDDRQTSRRHQRDVDRFWWMPKWNKEWTSVLRTVCRVFCRLVSLQLMAIAQMNGSMEQEREMPWTERWSRAKKEFKTVTPFQIEIYFDWVLSCYLLYFPSIETKMFRFCLVVLCLVVESLSRRHRWQMSTSITFSWHIVILILFLLRSPSHSILIVVCAVFCCRRTLSHVDRFDFKKYIFAKNHFSNRRLKTDNDFRYCRRVPIKLLLIYFHVADKSETFVSFEPKIKCVNRFSTWMNIRLSMHLIVSHIKRRNLIKTFSVLHFIFLVFSVTFSMWEIHWSGKFMIEKKWKRRK